MTSTAARKGKKILVMVATTCATAVLAGCTHPPRTPTPGGPTGSPHVSPSKPYVSTNVYPDPLVMDVGGVGPYYIGDSADALRAAGLIGEIDGGIECTGWFSARTGGRYDGTLQLAFRGGVLAWIGTAGGLDIRALNGARLGMTYAQIRSLYHGQGTSGTTSGGQPELIEASGDRVAVYSGDPIRAGVAGYYQVGLASDVLHDHPIPVDAHCQSDQQ